MKKKIISLCLVIALLATAITGATLAYFTDTDYNKNVMVTGNVKIDQIEKDYEGNDFVDNKPLYPVIEDITGTDWYGTDPNEVAKVVTVENEGHTTAYVRTLIAFEAGEAGKTFGENKEVDLLCGSYIHFSYHDDAPVKFAPVQAANGGDDVYINIGGTRYAVAVAYYNGNSATDSEGTKTSAIAPGETTTPSLTSVWLKSTAGNEFYDYVGDNYDILVLSQAVQTEGFDTAAEAFDASFGKMTADNVQDWFETYTESKLESADPTEAPETPAEP